MGGHIACVGRQEIRTEVLSENLKGRTHLGDLSMDGGDNNKMDLK